jgi:hypothetical protein
MQQSRQRLLRALSAVESGIEASFGIEAHLDSIWSQRAAWNKESAHIELEIYQSRMSCHQRALTRLLEVSSGTLKLAR